DDLEFEGFISTLVKNFVGGITMSIQCTGTTFELERYFTGENKTYTEEKTGAIVKDLLAMYAGGQFDLTHFSSTDGVTLQSIVFNAETLNTCFKRLTEFDGFNYYVGRKRRQ
ncbi:unnamed protein product, partial [marine sediment metagenome]